MGSTSRIEEAREELNRLFHVALADVMDDELPGRRQLLTNSFGIYLAWLWATSGLRGPKSNVHVYATEHQMKNGSHWSRLDERHLIDPQQMHRWEFLTDVFIERWDGKAQANSALLAGEIEASPNHSVAYVYEGQSYSDYLHDFSKLMYVAAPKRLFVACIDVGRMDDLKTTISRGFQAMRTRDSATTVTTAALLLPSATRQRESVSLGVGLEHTELEWSTV